MRQPEFCFEVMNRLDLDLTNQLENPKYMLVGGIMSHALSHEATVIDLEQKRIIAPMDASPTIVRKEDGSHRDADVVLPYVATKEQATIARRTIEKSTKYKLTASVFGFETKKASMDRHDRTQANIRQWTSRRSVDDQGRYYYDLYPLSMEVPAETYDTWNLQLPSGQLVKTISPLGILMAYKIRSISGIRHKDKEKIKDKGKIAALEDKVLSIPELKQQLQEGIFAPWQQFANDIATLGQSHYYRQESVIPGTSNSDLMLFFIKAHALKFAESHKLPVKLAHTHIGALALRPLNDDA